MNGGGIGGGINGNGTGGGKAGLSLSELMGKAQVTSTYNGMYRGRFCARMKPNSSPFSSFLLEKAFISRVAKSRAIKMTIFISTTVEIYSTVYLSTVFIYWMFQASSVGR